MSLDSVLQWLAKVFGKDGHISIEGEFTMDWKKALQDMAKNLDNIQIGIVLEALEIAASKEGYQAAIHYLLLAHNADVGAKAAGVTVEQAKKVIRGSVLQLH